MSEIFSYGPTPTNPNPGAMWHDGCGKEAMNIDDGYICGCGQEWQDTVCGCGQEWQDTDGLGIVSVAREVQQPLKPTRVIRHHPQPMWTVDAPKNYSGPHWGQNFEVRRYVDAHYGETVSVERRGSSSHIVEPVLRMEIEQARRLAYAILGATEWVDDE